MRQKARWDRKTGEQIKKVGQMDCSDMKIDGKNRWDTITDKTKKTDET